MAIAVVEELQAQDWERYAAFIGPFLPGLLLALAVIGLLVGQHVGTQICVLFIALFVALLETPGVFFLCQPPCGRLRDKLMEEGGLRKGWIRGLLFIILSLACFLPRPSIAILAGILLVLAGAVHIGASLFGDEPISTHAATMAGSKPPAGPVLPSYQPPITAASAATGGGAGAGAASKVAGFGTFDV